VLERGRFGSVPEDWAVGLYFSVNIQDNRVEIEQLAAWELQLLLDALKKGRGK
jgi:hypothetical protein